MITAEKVKAAAPRVTYHLRSYELRQPRTYVVAKDLAAVRDFRKWGHAELWQRKTQAGLLPATIALLLVLRPVHGLRGGEHGCGVQLSIKEWAEVLGYKETQVHNALRQAEDEGLIVRHQQTLPISKLTERRKSGPADVLHFKNAKARGKGSDEPHGKADAVTVVYLTKAGCRVVDAAGTTRVHLWGPTEQGRRQRFEVACGLLLALWKTLRTKLAAAWDRVAAVKKKCTPDLRHSRRRLSSTNVCSSNADLWKTRPLAGCGAAPEGRTPSRSTHDTHAPPSSARTQAHAPPGRAEPPAGCTAPHTSRPGGDGVDIPPVPEHILATLPEGFKPWFRTAWQHVRPAAKYRPPRHGPGAGRDASVVAGTRDVWSPLLTLKEVWPERCRNASRRELLVIALEFRPLGKALREAFLDYQWGKEAEAEAAAAAAALEAARAEAAHQLELDGVAETEALKRKLHPEAGRWPT